MNSVKRLSMLAAVLMFFLGAAAFVYGQVITENCPLSPPNTGPCQGGEYRPPFMNSANATMLDANDTTLRLVASGDLGGDHDFCQNGEPATYHAFFGEGDLGVPDGPVTVTAGVLAGQTLWTTYDGGSEGICNVVSTIAGNSHGFDAIGEIDVSAIPNGTYPLTLEVRSNHGLGAAGSGKSIRTATRNVSFTIDRTTTPPPTNHTLTVSKNGTGSGTVTSNVFGINCGSDCRHPYASGQVVQLTASPSGGSASAGWTGHSDCADGTVTMSADRSCTATFNAQPPQDVPPTGDHWFADNASCSVGGWAVDPDNTSADVTIRVYSDGSQVKTGTAGSYNSGLTGVCTGGTCAFSESLSGLISTGVNHSIRVDARDLQTGQWVTLPNSPRTINCAAQCGPGTLSVSSNRSTSWSITGPQSFSGSGSAGSYGSAAQGTYTISPAALAGYTLSVSPSAAQSLACSGSRSWTLTYTAEPVEHRLTVSKTGSGTVTSNPSGVSCGTDCYQDYAEGTNVTLYASPAAGYVFSGWSGDADCSNGVVTMSADRSCTANFAVAPAGTYQLTVLKSGTGSGTVTSNPSGVSCGSDCGQTYTGGTVVTLTPAAAQGSTFAGWTGTGCTSGTVTMSANRTCTATFNLQSQSGGTITVVSNAPTTWQLLGDTDYIETSPQTSKTYTGVPIGYYALYPAPDDGEACPAGYRCDASSPTIAPSALQLLCSSFAWCNNLTYTVTYADSPNECTDGVDNDGDMLIDNADPGCDGGDGPESSADPQCSDGVDNVDAEDALPDAQDPGCHTDGNAANAGSYDATDNDERDGGDPQCSDEHDNDGDALTDYPDDPGCDDENDPDEFNEGATQCSDDVDNDADGYVDYQNGGGDPDCTSDADNSERGRPQFEEF